MNTSAAWLGATIGAEVHRRRQHTRRLVGDAGEGVVSAAIAVLIMAFLGAAMWVAFNDMWTSTQGKVCSEVGKIGAGKGEGGKAAC